MDEEEDGDDFHPLSSSFNFESLKLLSSTCDRHIRELKRRKKPNSNDSDHNPQYNYQDKSLCTILSSLLFDFSLNLQNQTTAFNSFYVIQKCSDVIRKKLDGIDYFKWNRPVRKRYKNVLNRIFKRSIEPFYFRDFLTLERDFGILFPKFERSVNVWAHHFTFDDSVDSGQYEEPPIVKIVKFDVSGDVIITGGSEGIIKLWDAFSCKLIMSLKRHTGVINYIDVHPTNAFIISCCDGGEVYLWEVNLNFYRPHKMIKSSYKFHWVKFILYPTSHSIPIINILNTMDTVEQGNTLYSDNTTQYTNLNNTLNQSELKTVKQGDGLDKVGRIIWENAIQSTLVVTIDANSILRIFKMSDMIGSSAGGNVYNPVEPLYYIDLFNHKITAYDISKTTFNSGFFIAISIEPLDPDDLDDFDNINTALNYIKNDTFHKANFNIKGKYRGLIGKTGFALLSVPPNNQTPIHNVPQCHCDLPLNNTALSNICTNCGKLKLVERVKLPLKTQQYEENALESSFPKSMFLWSSDYSSEIEKFFNHFLPDFTLSNDQMLHSFTPNIPSMQHGKNSSTLILPAYLGSTPAFVKESGDFDTLFLNFVSDSHLLSPDVCFANTSTNHISASDDGKIFLWSYQQCEFRPIQLVTNTIQWFDDTYNDGDSVKNNVTYNLINLSWSCNDRYICVSDEVVSKSGSKKSKSGTKTYYSGISFFTSDGLRINHFSDKSVTVHISSISFNPVCENVCLVSCFDGILVILDVLTCTVLKKLNFGTTSIWVDVQWHPLGHKFVASQHYGSFSLFSSDSALIMQNTPNFQCTFSDYYSLTPSFENLSYRGPESDSQRIKKYYSAFSDLPITMENISTYELITRSIYGGFVVFLDEYKKNVLLHTSGLVKRVHSVPQSYDMVYRVVSKLPGFDDYFQLHKDYTVCEMKIISQFLNLKAKNGTRDEFKCFLGKCSACEIYSFDHEQSLKYQSLKDSFARLKTMTDSNGIIIKAIPPSERPKDLIETNPSTSSPTITARLFTFNNRPSRIIESPVQLSIPIDENTLIENEVNSEEVDTIPRVEIEQSDVIAPYEDDEDDEFELEIESHDEDEEELEDDDELVEEADFETPTRRSSRLAKQKDQTVRRALRSSQPSDSDMIKGEVDDLRVKEMELAKSLSDSIGPIAVLHHKINSFDAVCIFCGIGQDGDCSKLSRSQSQKLSTLFIPGSTFTPGCKFFENVILGPLNIPKRYQSHLEDFVHLSKRVKSGQIYAHASCILTSKVVINETRKLVNLPGNFATITCSKCQSLYHYPCAIAEYNRATRDFDILNHFDPLICTKFLCVECAKNDAIDFLSGARFLNSKSRPSSNRMDPNVGDYVVLTKDVVFQGINTHITWITQLDFPILVKIIDKTFVFTGDETVMPCVLVEPVFDNFDPVCIFIRPNVKLILLVHFLLSFAQLNTITIGSKIKFMLDGEIVQKVKNIKSTNSKHHVDEDDFKKIIKLLYSIGHNCVEIQDKWINAWDLLVEPYLEDQVNVHLFDGKDKEYFHQLLEQERFSVFKRVEEWKNGAQEWLNLYWRVIPRPIGIDEIIESMDIGLYNTPEAVYLDVSLLIENCLTFNSSNSHYAKIALELKKELEKAKFNTHWKVIHTHTWPLIKHYFKTSLSNVNIDSVPNVQSVKNKKEVRIKRKAVIIEGPTRKSCRLSMMEKRFKSEIKVRKKSAYNLR